MASRATNPGMSQQNVTIPALPLDRGEVVYPDEAIAAIAATQHSAFSTAQGKLWGPVVKENDIKGEM